MLCCVCLIENPSNMGVFDEIGQQLKIAEVIQKYLWFKPEPDNILTSKICTMCWHKINDFHIFYQTIEIAHKEYEQNAPINIKLEIPFYSPVNLKPDYGGDEVINSNDLIEPKYELEFKNPLEENYTEALTNGDSDDDDYRSDYDEPLISSQEELLVESHNDTDEFIQDDINTKKKRQKCRRNLEKDKSSAIKKRSVQRLNPLHTEEMIKKYIPMGCDLCVFVGTNFSDIVQHFKNVHPNVRPYIMCCDKKFSKRSLVAHHALIHEDPNRFRCEDCNKTFTEIRGLRKHNLTYHPQNEDLIFACDSCPKKYARINLLQVHKNSHIPREQWQYFCNICPDKKRFASSYLLNIHTNMRHKKDTNICPVCAKEIRNKNAYEKHVRLHYEDSGPRVKCPYPDCNSWLKDEDNLRQHFERHNPKGIIHKCDECDKECKNRRALTNHKNYAHTNKVFQCDQCDKSFKKSLSLREHLTQHTGETLYKCPFCARTFNSSANMHAHKKKQHAVEWEEWRKNNRGSSQKLIYSSSPLS